MAIRKQACKFRGYIEVEFPDASKVPYQAWAPQQFAGENVVFNTGAVAGGPVLEYQSFAWNLQAPIQNSLFTPAGFITAAQRFEGAYIDGRAIGMRRQTAAPNTNLELYYVDQPPNIVGGVVTPAPALSTATIAYTPPPGVFYSAYSPQQAPGYWIAAPWNNGGNIGMAGFIDAATTGRFNAFQLEADEDVNNVLRGASMVSGGRGVTIYGVDDVYRANMGTWRLKRYIPSPIGEWNYETVQLELSNHGPSQMNELIPNQSFDRRSFGGFICGAQNFDPYPRLKNGEFPQWAMFEFSPSGEWYKIWLLHGGAEFQAENTFIPYIGKDSVVVFTNNAGPNFSAFSGYVENTPPRYPFQKLPCQSPCIPLIDNRPE